ncbi:MAG: T9SS type A sorting domain-containing protein [Lewinellaceae bacterium]|nr:T9SS type A sorting domain-containing protein [Lewinellaceae bacterium]
MNRIVIFFIVFIFGISLDGFGQATYESKSGGGAWSSTGSWKLAQGSLPDSPSDGIPDANDNVIINNGDLISVSSLQACASIIIKGNNGQNATLSISGGTLDVGGNLSVEISGGSYYGFVTMSSGGILNILGTFDSNASFTPGDGTVNYYSTTTQSIKATTYYNLTFSGGGTKTFTGAAIATNNLTISDGSKIDLANFNFTLTAFSATSLTHNSGWMYGGDFTRYFDVVTLGDGDAAGLFPIGSATDYRPFYISPTAVLSLGGAITVSHTDAAGAVDVSISDGGNTIVRRTNLYWTVSVSGFVIGWNFNLHAEGTGLGIIGDVGDLTLTQANSVVGSAGTNGGTTSNPIIRRTGLTLSEISNDFYVGSIDAISSPLPVTWLSFRAALTEDGNANLFWSTASESNNEGFDIQRSLNGRNWETIGFVAGAGTTSEVQSYTYTDNSLSTFNSQLAYYRLQQRDFDGTTDYSPVRVLELSGEAGGIRVFPNPASEVVTIAFSEPTESRGSVKLLTQNNRLIVEQVIAPQTTEHQLRVAPVPSGTYILKVKVGNKEWTKRLVVE